jgi:RsiW-degrading membrane proteinase PrsW (M82 family)
MLMSCGALVALGAFFAVGCALLNLASGFAQNPGIGLLSLVNAIALGIPYLMAILWLDRNEKEPPLLILTALFWGAVMATGASCLVNSVFGAIIGGIVQDPAAASQLTASLSAPPVEETTKGLALLFIWLFFKKDFDNVLDGIIYGALVGLGFAVFENFLYYARNETTEGVFALTFLRGVVAAVGSHPCYTALTGAGFGLFRVMRKGVLRWFMPVGGWILAMFVHFSWNTFTAWFLGMAESDAEALFIWAPLAGLVIHVPFVLLVVVVSAVTLWHEHGLIKKYLSNEKAPVLHEGELKILVPAFRRGLHTMWLFITFRWGMWWTRRKRNHLLIKLAFERWHMDKEADQHDSAEKARSVLKLREQLSSLTPEDL